MRSYFSLKHYNDKIRGKNTRLEPGYQSVVCITTYFQRAITTSYQYWVWEREAHINGSMVLDRLLTQCYYHRGTQLNATKRFCICNLWFHLNILIFFSPCEGCSEGLDAFIFFFKRRKTWVRGGKKSYNIPQKSIPGTIQYQQANSQKLVTTS